MRFSGVKISLAILWFSDGLGKVCTWNLVFGILGIINQSNHYLFN